jgi:hypothetical protein
MRMTNPAFHSLHESTGATSSAQTLIEERT